MQTGDQKRWTLSEIIRQSVTPAGVITLMINEAGFMCDATGIGHDQAISMLLDVLDDHDRSPYVFINTCKGELFSSIDDGVSFVRNLPSTSACLNPKEPNVSLSDPAPPPRAGVHTAYGQSQYRVS